MRRFEDINAWGKARQLVREICEVSAQGTFGNDFALRDQTRRGKTAGELPTGMLDTPRSALRTLYWGGFAAEL